MAYSEDRRQTAYATFFTGTTFEPVSGQRWNPGESFIRDRGNPGAAEPGSFERFTTPLPAMSGGTSHDRSGLSRVGTPFGESLKAVGEVPVVRITRGSHFGGGVCDPSPRPISRRVRR